MYGSTQSLAMGQQVPPGVMNQGYPAPGMMYPGMWRTNSFSNLQSNSVAPSPALKRATSATNLQATENATPQGRRETTLE